MVVANSDLGDGYKPKTPITVSTQHFDDALQVYVWGHNASSEIGLTDILVD